MITWDLREGHETEQFKFRNFDLKVEKLNFGRILKKNLKFQESKIVQNQRTRKSKTFLSRKNVKNQNLPANFQVCQKPKLVKTLLFDNLLPFSSQTPGKITLNQGVVYPKQFINNKKRFAW